MLLPKQATDRARYTWAAVGTRRTSSRHRQGPEALTCSHLLQLIVEALVGLGTKPPTPAYAENTVYTRQANLPGTQLALAAVRQLEILASALN